MLKKNNWGILSVLLAALLLFCLSASAFAEDPVNEGNNPPSETTEFVAPEQGTQDEGNDEGNADNGGSGDSKGEGPGVGTGGNGGGKVDGDAGSGSGNGSIDAGNASGAGAADEGSGGQGSKTTEGSGAVEPDRKPKAEPKPVEEPNVYSVCFFDYDGGEFDLLMKRVTEGDRIPEPFWTPMNNGMTFLYWFDQRDEYMTPFQFQSQRVYRDINLIARYELIQLPDEPQTNPNFGDSGMSGVPNLPKDNGFVKDPDGLTRAGDIFEDDHVKGTAVGHRAEGGFVVTIIQIDEEKNGDEVLDDEDLNDEDFDDEELDDEELDDEELDDEKLNDEELDDEELDDEELDDEELDDEELDDEELDDEELDDEELDDEELNDEELNDEEAEIEGSVSARLQQKPTYESGDQVTLYGRVEGYEGAVDMQYQWQYSPDGGESWLEQEGATSLNYTFTMTEENMAYLWRLTVSGTIPNVKEVA